MENQTNIKKHNKFLYIILTSILCITSLFGAYFIKTTINKSKQTPNAVNSGSNNNLTTVKVTSTPVPQFIASPINGVMLQKARYDEIANRPPLAVMIQNHTESRPQSGLNEADIVYETLAEGGITRFMGVFWSQDVERLMSIRSARKYFVDLLGDYKNVVYFHEGYADGEDNVSAIKAINTYGVKTLGLAAGGLRRDLDCQKVKAIEHCAYTSTDILWNLAAQKKWTGNADQMDTWKYKEDKDVVDQNAKSVTDFDVVFPGSYNDYSSNWKYDSATKEYMRFNINNTKFNDSKGKQISTDVVIYQQIVSYPANDYKHHMVQNVIGEGKGSIMQDGKVYLVTWKKPNFSTKTRFYDAVTNQEFKFKRGRIWDVLISNAVDYKDNTPAQATSTPLPTH